MHNHLSKQSPMLFIFRRFGTQRQTLQDVQKQNYDEFYLYNAKKPSIIDEDFINEFDELEVRFPYTLLLIHSCYRFLKVKIQCHQKTDA